MAKDPGFIFYPGDYLRDTQVLSEHSQVAYDRIMCEHMRNICISKSQLNFLTKKLSDNDKNEIMSVLAEVKGGFQIPWVASSIIARRAYSASRRNNRKGKKGKDMSPLSDSYDSHMDNENEILLAVKNKKELLGDQLFHEQTCMALSVSMVYLTGRLQQFANEKTASGELAKQYAEVRRHFVNWLKKEIEKNPGGVPGKKKVVI